MPWRRDRRSDVSSQQGVSGKWGDECGSGMTNRVVAGWGLADGMGCTFGGETRPAGPERSLDVFQLGQLLNTRMEFRGLVMLWSPRK
jgi:hypothetical protein